MPLPPVRLTQVVPLYPSKSFFASFQRMVPFEVMLVGPILTPPFTSSFSVGVSVPMPTFCACTKEAANNSVNRSCNRMVDDLR